MAPIVFTNANASVQKYLLIGIDISKSHCGDNRRKRKNFVRAKAFRSVAARELVLIRCAFTRGGGAIEEDVRGFTWLCEADITSQGDLTHLVFDFEIGLFGSVDGENARAGFGNELDVIVAVGGPSGDVAVSETSCVGKHIADVHAAANARNKFAGANGLLVLDKNTFSNGVLAELRFDLFDLASNSDFKLKI